MKNSIELTEEQIAKRTFLKLKIKHLALEPGLIRFEHDRRRRNAEKRGKDYSKWLEVRTRQHKIDKIRPEARAAFLAYAFIRGKSFNQVEPNTKAIYHAIVLNRAAEIALKYGDFPSGTTRAEAYRAIVLWFEAALAARAVVAAEKAEVAA